jgi:DNA-binding response OmpR family regulator
MTANPKILCVEDEKDLRENISTILESEGFDVIQAENGIKAYEEFINKAPDIILCDINMPIMDGRKLLDKLSNDHKEQLAKTPFLFITAFGQKDEKLLGIELGADEYILKPIDFDILLSTIKTKLRKTQTQQHITAEKMLNLCENVSNLIPESIKEPLENIIQLSAAIKHETNGKYDQTMSKYAGKIYLSALKLNAQITRALDKNKIIAEANNLNHEISTSEIITFLKNEINDFTVNYEEAENLPKIKLDINKFLHNLSNYLKQHNKAESKNITLSFIEDFHNNLLITISSETFLPIFSSQLESTIEEFGGTFTIQNRDELTYHIITIPYYLTKK